MAHNEGTYHPPPALLPWSQLQSSSTGQWGDLPSPCRPRGVQGAGCSMMGRRSVCFCGSDVSGLPQGIGVQTETGPEGRWVLRSYTVSRGAPPAQKHSCSRWREGETAHQSEQFCSWHWVLLDVMRFLWGNVDIQKHWE